MVLFTSACLEQSGAVTIDGAVQFVGCIDTVPTLRTEQYLYNTFGHLIRLYLRLPALPTK